MIPREDKYLLVDISLLSPEVAVTTTWKQVYTPPMPTIRSPNQIGRAHVEFAQRHTMTAPSTAL